MNGNDARINSMNQPVPPDEGIPLGTFDPVWASGATGRVLLHPPVRSRENAVMPGKKTVRLPNRRRRISVTGYRGVVEQSLTRWYACVSREGRKYALGTFDSPHHAALAVNIATELLF